MTEPVREVMSIKQPRLFSEEALAAFDSFDAVAALVREQGIATVNAADLGNGFSVLATKNKGQLVDVPFIIVDWRFNNGDQGEFVTLMLVTKDGRKLILNDGSTGVYEQMKGLTKKLNGGRAAVMCEKGLNRSDYTVTIKDKDGNDKESDATTYYLNLERGSL